ncbi:MAG TPA: YkgJ family cysteine cluster protein [Nannocystis exedens]|nr:YkgJ family cysteine cluster protein [Nannocystis exedens]
MVLDFLRGLFGRKHRLPIDRVTRAPRAAKKAAKADIEGMQRALDRLGALEGIADIATKKRLPQGTEALWREFLGHYDGYLKIVAEQLGISDAARPGTKEGSVSCYVAPFGVAGLESLVIFRTVRLWRDFPDVAQRLAHAGEQLFKDIQSHHGGADPEKIRMTGPAVMQGRLENARRLEPCPLLDQERGRCRIWEIRPLVCRGHFVTGDPAQADPTRDDYLELPVKNLRLPIHQQVAHMQLEKRLMLQLTPFLSANILVLLQLVEGQMLPEIGEPPTRFGPNGVAVPKANRNRPSAKAKAKGKTHKKSRKSRRS